LLPNILRPKLDPCRNPDRHDVPRQTHTLPQVRGDHDPPLLIELHIGRPGKEEADEGPGIALRERKLLQLLLQSLPLGARVKKEALVEPARDDAAAVESLPELCRHDDAPLIIEAVLVLAHEHRQSLHRVRLALHNPPLLTTMDRQFGPTGLNPAGFFNPDDDFAAPVCVAKHRSGRHQGVNWKSWTLEWWRVEGLRWLLGVEWVRGGEAREQFHLRSRPQRGQREVASSFGGRIDVGSSTRHPMQVRFSTRATGRPFRRSYRDSYRSTSAEGTEAAMRSRSASSSARLPSQRASAAARSS